MQTSSATPTQPASGRRARAVLVVALAAGLVAGVVGVREGSGSATTAADLERIADSVDQGCVEQSSDLASTTGFALDGTVLAVTLPADTGAPVVVELEVAEWFLGPPLDRVRVRVDPGTVRSLRDAGGPLAPGLRLLVSGRGWGAGADAPAAAGCGRTRLHDAGTAEDWRSQLPATEPVGPLGPVARYPDAGFVRTNPDNAPELAGVLLLERGCLYVDDGLVRWVPVFAGATSRWVEHPPQLLVGSDAVDVGHAVRLGGLPASGVPRRGVLEVDGPTTPPERLDPAGLPDGCRPEAPRFVVSDPPAGGPADVVTVAEDDRLLQDVVRAATAAGLGPTDVGGEVRRDSFGASSVRVAAQTERAGEVLVHVESVSFLAWPRAYAPADATFLWALDPEQAPRLPRPTPGTQLAVVQRADGVTQLLVRTGPRVVLSVSADPTTAPGDPVEGRELIDALATVAAGVGGVAAGRPARTPTG